MKINKILTSLTIVALFLAGCKSTDRIITMGFDGEERILDTISVVASRKGQHTAQTYHASPKRVHDLLHTKLDVSFDWQRQYLHGKAILDLKPIFYTTNQLRLDAKGFDIHKIAMITPLGQVPLQYKYENKKDLYITLDKPYKKDEKYSLYITYTAKPNELPLGGSNAITSDKGLYFINPLGKEPNKPKQIWTQGETESSSCWFPTIDRPNERCTQEIFITVEDKYKTLSNGLLQNSIQNNDGTRTDYWVMDLPHAPYLFAMVVGEFSVTIDEWNGKLLEYYVEPKYKDHATNIYKNTKEMLGFFSDKFGVSYPWAKYSQVVVRDYVSGAMENTTAVIFGDFVQLTTRELLDHGDLNESIVAHEMMHHWFGDLVTCESWSNLPLNESFANYSEYLWFEYKYGRDAADYIRKNEITGYMNQAIVHQTMHPLIDYNYTDKEEMFDAHSYNKGGTILHMLRYYVGDEAYFASLQKYLEDNKYKATEVHDLRLAFEAVTGEDLNWFFNQWFFTAGHPKLEITKEYDAASRTLKVTVEQTQDLQESTIFILPFAIDIYNSLTGTAQRHEVKMTKKKQTFSFYTGGEPVWVGVDAERVILSQRNYKQSKEELINQYLLSKRFQDRYDALKELRYLQKGNAKVTSIFEQAMEDSFWAIRQLAIDGIDINKKDAILINKIIKIAQKDTRSHVRRAAMERIGGLQKSDYLDVCKNAITSEQSYLVIAAALQAINNTDSIEGMYYAEMLKNSENISILLEVAQIFENSKQKKYLNFYEQKWDKTNNYARFSFLNSYARLLIHMKDESLLLEKASLLEKQATNKGVSQWGRYAACAAIKKLREEYKEPFEKDYKVIVKKITGLKRQNTEKALAALKQMAQQKTKANYNNAIEEIKLLNGNSVESILNLVDKFSTLTPYDKLSLSIGKIKDWETNPMLKKLYTSW